MRLKFTDYQSEILDKIRVFPDKPNLIFEKTYEEVRTVITKLSSLLKNYNFYSDKFKDPKINVKTIEEDLTRLIFIHQKIRKLILNKELSFSPVEFFWMVDIIKWSFQERPYAIGFYNWEPYQKDLVSQIQKIFLKIAQSFDNFGDLSKDMENLKFLWAGLSPNPDGILFFNLINRFGEGSCIVLLLIDLYDIIEAIKNHIKDLENYNFTINKRITHGKVHQYQFCAIAKDILENFKIKPRFDLLLPPQKADQYLFYLPELLKNHEKWAVNRPKIHESTYPGLPKSIYKNFLKISRWGWFRWICYRLTFLIELINRRPLFCISIGDKYGFNKIITQLRISDPSLLIRKILLTHGTTWSHQIENLIKYHPINKRTAGAICQDYMIKWKINPNQLTQEEKRIFKMLIE